MTASASVMNHHGIAKIVVGETGLLGFETQVNILGVHEVIGAEPTDLVKHRTVHHQARP